MNQLGASNPHTISTFGSSYMPYILPEWTDYANKKW